MSDTSKDVHHAQLDDIKHIPTTTTTIGDDELHGFQANESSLPKGYYRSSFFVGTMFATGLGLSGGVGGFALAAPELGVINADIGPDANVTWVSLVYTLTLAIGLLLVGRLSDLFGYVDFYGFAVAREERLELC